MAQTKTKHPGRGAGAATAPAFLNDDRILSFRQWCELNGISPKTGQRLLKSGNGPQVTMLTDRKIGVAVRHNRSWQESRAR